MKCTICGCEIKGKGNNSEPVNKGKCCDKCNKIIIKERISKIRNK